MKRNLLPFVIAGIFCSPVFAHESATAEYGTLGKVNFANSCDAAIQEDLQRAVAMLHSFWFVAAEKSFAELAKRDPSCVIARWGYASILMSNPLAGQGALPVNVPKAQAAIDEARKIGAKTQRERDYLEAVAAYYDDFANRPERARQVSRAKAYEALAAKYPNDDEAQIFSALYTAGTQQQSDQTYAAYLKAAAALETQFSKYPDHPGVAHYLIHSYDAPPIASKGLDAARRYASIAPNAPHALHMPSHIFTRVGSWEESAATNLRSAAVAKASGEGDEYCHAHDYAVYAVPAAGSRRGCPPDDGRRLEGAGPDEDLRGALCARRDARPLRPRAQRLEVGDEPARPDHELSPGQRASPFRAGDGRDPKRQRGDGFQGREALAGIHAKLTEAKNTYWAREVEVQRLMVAAWSARASGNSAEGLKLMRAAADLEDSAEKAHRDSRSHAAGARAVGRHAARGEAAGRGAQGVRSVASARAQSLSQFRQRGARGRDGGRQGEGARELREASRAGEESRREPPELVKAKGLCRAAIDEGSRQSSWPARSALFRRARSPIPRRRTRTSRSATRTMRRAWPR
jgi:hypothetical protein